MESFIKDATEFTPKINFDAETNIFEISGFSRPENVIGFFKPILIWLEKFYDESLAKNIDFDKSIITFNAKLTYFNSASSKYMLDIFLELFKLQSNGNTVVVNWFYEDGDDEILESGEELADMVGMTFNFIEY